MRSDFHIYYIRFIIWIVFNSYRSLPNWLNLKTHQEFRARNERSARRNLRREQLQPSEEEESPEDVRMRNRREAEILASNLGEGGVSAGEILSDINLLKELAQLQETMVYNYSY